MHTPQHSAYHQPKAAHDIYIRRPHDLDWARNLLGYHTFKPHASESFPFPGKHDDTERVEQNIPSSLKYREAKSFNLPPFLGVSPRCLEQSRPCLGVLGFDGLFGRLDTQPALLIHGDCLAWFETRALGNESGSQARIASLKCLVEKWLPPDGALPCSGYLLDLIPISSCDQRLEALSSCVSFRVSPTAISRANVPNPPRYPLRDLELALYLLCTPVISKFGELEQGLVDG
jgi:hypothetical protein